MAAQDIVGTWAKQSSHRDVIFQRWSGPGDLTASWVTPEIDLHGLPWVAWVMLYGSGAATDGGSSPGLQAMVHPEDIVEAYASADDIMPRVRTYFIGSYGAAYLLAPSTFLDSSSGYDGAGRFLSNYSASAATPPILMGPTLKFYYAAGGSTGTAALEYIDLYMVRSR